MSMNAPVARRPHTSRDLVSAPESTNLADLLERVLDKGVVVAGDIVIALGAVELLTLKVRLLIASIDKARELGIDWWEHDAFVSSGARARELEGDTDLLRKRLERLERLLLPPPQEADQDYADAVQWSNTPPAYVLDKQGKVIAELTQPGPHAHEAEQPHEEAGLQAQKRTSQLHEEEQPHAPERTPQPQAAPAEQPAGAGQLTGETLQERIAHATRPIPEELPQPITQARSEGRQDEEQPQEEEPPQAAQRTPQPQGEERPLTPERTPQPQTTPAEQPVGAGLLLGQTLQERMAQAMRPVLAELPQRIAQAWQPAVQGRPAGQHGEEQNQEQPHAPERTSQPQATPAEQPAGAGPLLGPSLHEHIAQAVRPVLAELRQRNAQARRPAAQGRPAG